MFYIYLDSLLYNKQYYLSNIGTPSEIRTHRTTPFERADFANLSIGALNIIMKSHEKSINNYMILYQYSNVEYTPRTYSTTSRGFVPDSVPPKSEFVPIPTLPVSDFVLYEIGATSRNRT